MDKRRAIQIMTKAAELYRDNLEDQKVLFLYALPSEIKKELQTEGKVLSSIKGYEVAFHRYNFLHLTGVKLNKSETVSAIHFYEKCLDKRLTEHDFFLAKDGSTGQKLDILERMMLIKKNVTMIGEFTDRGPKLFTEKAAGNVCGCIGFVSHCQNTSLAVQRYMNRERDNKNKALKLLGAFFMQKKASTSGSLVLISVLYKQFCPLKDHTVIVQL